MSVRLTMRATQWAVHRHAVLVWGQAVGAGMWWQAVAEGVV